MNRSGESQVLYTQIDGQPLGKVNFVLRDSQGSPLAHRHHARETLDALDQREAARRLRGAHR